MSASDETVHNVPPLKLEEEKKGVAGLAGYKEKRSAVVVLTHVDIAAPAPLGARTPLLTQE